MAQEKFKVVYRDNESEGIEPTILTIVPAGTTVTINLPWVEEADNLAAFDVIQGYQEFNEWDEYKGVLPNQLDDIRAQIEDATTIAALRTAVLREFDYRYKGEQWL